MLSIRDENGEIAYFDEPLFDETDEGDDYYNSLSLTYDSINACFVVTLLNDNNDNTGTYTFTSNDYDDTNTKGLSYVLGVDNPDIRLRNTVIYDYIDFSYVTTPEQDLTMYIVPDVPVVETNLDVEIQDVNGTTLYTNTVQGTTLTRITSQYSGVLDTYDIRFYYMHNGSETYDQQIVPADGSDVPFGNDFAGFELDGSGQIDFTTSYIITTDPTVSATIMFVANQPTPPNPTFDMDISIDKIDGTIDNSVTVSVYQFTKFEMTYNATYHYYDLRYVYEDGNGYTITGHLYSVADGVDVPYKDDIKAFSVNGSGEYHLGTEYINNALTKLDIKFILLYNKGTPKDLLGKCCDVRLKDVTIDNVLYDMQENDFFKCLYDIFATPPAWIRNYQNISDEYFMNHSGMKFISPMMKRLMKDVMFKSDYTSKIQRLVQTFWIRYGQDIENYYLNYKTKYMIDHEEGYERTRTPDLTENVDWSENKEFSDTQSGSPSQSYYGFNSSSATPVSSNTLDSKVEHSALKKDNYETTERRHTGTETVVEDQKHYHGDLFDNGLKAIQFFDLYNFYSYMFKKIDTSLTIDLY